MLDRRQQRFMAQELRLIEWIAPQMLPAPIHQ
jgi:hypothetical protein